MRARDNPLLLARKGDVVHKVVTGDIFFEGTPVRIMCVAIGVVIEDVQETERGLPPDAAHDRIRGQQEDRRHVDAAQE